MSENLEYKAEKNIHKIGQIYDINGGKLFSFYQKKLFTPPVKKFKEICCQSKKWIHDI